MSNHYSYLDHLSEDQITEFKKEGKDAQLDQIEIKSGIFNFISKKPMIIAEGDSWFDYLPGTDILDCLRKHHKYYIKKYAKAGDTLENMIYGTGYNNDFQRTTPTINEVLEKIGKEKPLIFLFSGGGNDIAGDEFASYLNHCKSGLPLLRENYIDEMINVVFKKYFIDLIDKISAVSPNTNIVTHGYGHTIPTGKGVTFLFFDFAGPWLKPSLAMKGEFDPIKQQSAVAKLIDVYNLMLADLDHAYKKFHHIDLRDLIDPYNDWANELHLKNSVYAKTADLFHKKIVQIQESQA